MIFHEFIVIQMWGKYYFCEKEQNLKSSTRGAHPLLKWWKMLNSIKIRPQIPDKYVRTSGTPKNIPTKSAIFKIC